MSLKNRFKSGNPTPGLETSKRKSSFSKESLKKISVS